MFFVSSSDTMEKKLAGMIGDRVDLNCGHGCVFRGTVRAVEDGLVTLLSDEEKNIYIDIEKIVAVTDSTDSISRPGFIV